MKAIFCKSEALYNLCKFEYALLGYLKGSRLVPDSEAFKLGHIKCKKTINNSLTSDMFSVEDGRVVRFLDNFDMNSLYGGNVVKGKRESFFTPEAFILGAFVETWSNKYFQSDLTQFYLVVCLLFVHYLLSRFTQIKRMLSRLKKISNKYLFCYFSHNKNEWRL